MTNEIEKYIKNEIGIYPEKLIVENSKKIPKGNVLDIGCGRGRHSLYLAKQGFYVDAIDSNKKYIEFLNHAKEKYVLNIKTFCLPILEYKFPKNHYSIIICSWILNHIVVKEREILYKNLINSLTENGVIIIIALSDNNASKYHNEMIYDNPITLDELSEKLRLATLFYKIYNIEGKSGKKIHYGYLEYIGKKIISR